MPIPRRVLGLSLRFPPHVQVVHLDPVQFQSSPLPHCKLHEGLDSRAPLGEEAGPGHPTHSCPPRPPAPGGVSWPGGEGGRDLNSLGCRLSSGEPFSAPPSPLSTPGLTSRYVGSVPPSNSTCAFPGSHKDLQGLRVTGTGCHHPYLPSTHGTARPGPSHSTEPGARTPEFCPGSRCACPCPLRAGIPPPGEVFWRPCSKAWLQRRHRGHPPHRRRPLPLPLAGSPFPQPVAVVGRRGQAWCIQQTGGAWPLGRSFASKVLSPLVLLFQNNR